MLAVTHDTHLVRTHSAQSVSSATQCTRRGSLMAKSKRHSIVPISTATSSAAMRRSNSGPYASYPAPAPPRFPAPSSSLLHAPEAASSSASSSTSASAAPQPDEPGASTVPASVSDGAASSSCSRLPSPLMSRRERLQRSISPSMDVFDDEYEDEILAYMARLEDTNQPHLAMMDAQPEVTWSMRPYLIDFLIEMHASFDFQPETLFVSVALMDRYLSKRVVLKKHYQLAGAAAMWIASKYEDAKDSVPSSAELVTMCCNSLDESAFHQMESHILSTLNYALGAPSHETWLRTYLGRSTTTDAAAVARLLLELSLYHRDFVALKASAVTRASLWLAQLIHSSSKPLAATVVHAQRVLDSEAAHAATLLHRHLATDKQSGILYRKHAKAYAIIRDAFQRTRAAQMLLSPSPQRNKFATALPLHTPPHSGGHALPGFGGSGAAAMSPTPSLWLTPRSMSAVSVSTDEEDDGPPTPCTVMSPLPSTDGEAMHRGNATVDVDLDLDLGLGLDVVGMRLRCSESAPERSVPAPNSLHLTLDGADASAPSKHVASVVPLSGPQIVVNHGL